MTTTSLYRLYDAEDVLLYVGISKSALMRLGQHLSDKPWAVDVARTTVEWYPTREEAAAAEVAAILTEKPLHNIVHNARPVPRSPAGPEVPAACDVCGQSVLKAGYLILYGDQLRSAEQSHRDYRDYEKQFRLPGGWISMTGTDLLNAPATRTARWRSLHRDCDTKDDTGDYALDIYRPLTLSDLDDHTRHVMHKRWFRYTDWPLFILRLVRQPGAVFRRECTHKRTKPSSPTQGSQCPDCGVWVGVLA